MANRALTMLSRDTKGIPSVPLINLLNHRPALNVLPVHCHCMCQYRRHVQGLRDGDVGYRTIMARNDQGNSSPAR